MVEIRYRKQSEEADLAGRSLADVRLAYREKLNIPDKAVVRLNNRKVKPGREPEIKLRAFDKVEFAVGGNGKKLILFGAGLLAFVFTGGAFASGFINSTTMLNAQPAGGDFATITSAPGQPAWTLMGLSRGSIGSGNLFIVDTSTSGYTGDLVVTVSFANTGDLVGAYRQLNLRLYATASDGNPIDINSNGVIGQDDTAFLTLENNKADFYIDQLSGSGNFTIKVKSGYYISNAYNPGWSSQQPLLYAEVAQR